MERNWLCVLCLRLSAQLISSVTDYYSRFRPGLFTVLAILAFISCVAQVVVQRLNYRIELQRINR